MPNKQSGDYTEDGDKAQKTDKGLTIPTPTKDAFKRALGKAAPKPEESEKEPRQTHPSE